MESTGTMAFPEAAITSRTRACDSVAFEMPSHPSTVSLIRDRVRRFARAMPFTADQIDDISIAVGEASTNAIKYGYNPLYPRVGIRIEKRADVFRIFVMDRGPGFDPCAICPPQVGDLCECGRGIMCMRALMDQVEFHNLEPGTCVEMTKKLML